LMRVRVAPTPASSGCADGKHPGPDIETVIKYSYTGQM